MPDTGTLRARSSEAKREREQAILAAAAELATAGPVRDVTLTEIAAAVGMHKSAMLRYFETREQIFLILTAEHWREWSAALRAELARMTPRAPAARIAAAFASSLTARPLFCDLLAQAPLNLERNVSVEAVRQFKLVTHAQVDLIGAEIRRLRPGRSELETVDLIAAAVSMAGAFWQMANPGPEIARLYRSDPQLGHAVVEVGPRLIRILTPLIGPSV
jgi:AcrR family transcriptional regulator